MKKVYVLFLALFFFLMLTGCQEKIIYIYPDYPKTKILPRIKTEVIEVTENGCISAESTPKVFKLIKKLRVKEYYSDKALKRLNEFSAKISNKKSKNKETK